MASTPERQLWAAVLHQAFKDASRLPDLALREAIRVEAPDGTFQIDLQAARQAVVWLSRPSADLRTVCDLAGCDIDAVVAQGEELLLAKVIDIGIIHSEVGDEMDWFSGAVVGHI